MDRPMGAMLESMAEVTAAPKGDSSEKKLD